MKDKVKGLRTKIKLFYITNRSVDVMEMKQNLKVMKSEKEGYVYIIQAFSLNPTDEYVYEVPNEHVEATINELRAMFEKMAGTQLEGYDVDWTPALNGDSVVELEDKA